MTSSSPSTEEIESVRNSFGRCCMQEAFWDAFYGHFTRSSPEIGQMFRDTDLEKQKILLRESINFVIMYAKNPESGLAKNKIEQVGGIHSRGKINVRPELYPLWENSLMNTIKEFDPQFDPKLEKNWHNVLKPALDRMISLY